MEFIAGIIFTLFVEFIGYKIYQSRQRRKERERMPAGYKPQATPKDFPDRQEP